MGNQLIKDIGKCITRYNVFSKIKEGKIMYNYKIEDEISNKVISNYNTNSKKSGLDSVVDEIKKINNNFLATSISEYKAPGFQKKEMPKTTQAEILKQAEDSLATYKIDSQSSINNKFDEKIETLNNSKATLDESKMASKNEVKSYYDNAKESVGNDALKRGLGRSSIVINNLNALTADEIDSYKALDKEYSDTLNAINFELNSLGQQKQKALSDFDIAYAVKLNDKINSLNAELAKKTAEVIEYNNKIVEKEADYKNKYDEFVAEIQSENFDNNAKLIDLTAKYGENVLKDYKANRIFDLLDSYFSTMGQEEVMDVLNDSSFKSAVGGDLSQILKRYSK